jgi:hypothetical protein
MSDTTTDRRANLAAQTVTLLVALAVGVLVGREFCAPQPEPLEAEDVDCPIVAPEIVEYCPPEPEPEPPKEVADPPDPPPRQAESQGTPLPDEPPPVSPEQRRRLLAWARNQSATLQGCPRDRGQTYRFAVTLFLDDEKKIDDVAISSDEELGTELRSCLTERILQWNLPDDVDPPQREVVFRLSL